MLKPISRWFSNSPPPADSEAEQLKSRIEELERELQLHRKIKIVADMQHANVCKLLKEQEQFQRLWLFTADAIQQVRDTLSNTALEGELQLQQLARAGASQQRFNTLLQNSPLGRAGLLPADVTVDSLGSAAEIDQLLRDFLEHTSQMAKNIEFSANKSFLVTAKLDHIIWKTEIYRLFWGKSDKTIEDFSDHSKSRLGRWYYHGDGFRLYHGHRTYQALEQPQKEVHECGLQALTCAFQKDSAGAFKHLEKMEEASTRVLQLLGDLSTEVAAQHHDPLPAAVM